MAAPAYDLRYETSPGRCMWCWEALPEVESHTVVGPRRPPYFDGRPLRFHHQCWPEYLSLARFAAPAKGTGFEVTPETLERLRIEAHLSLRDMSRKLKISQERYLAIVQGDMARVTDSIVRLARDLAGKIQFGRNRGGIDWTQPEAIFCLRAHSGKSGRLFAGDLGLSQGACSLWELHGVPRSSLRVVHHLDRLAERLKFDAGMVLADRDWTPEYLIRVLKTTRVSKHLWAIRAGCAAVQIHAWATGRKKISRMAAWKLTRAAVSFGVELPPEKKYRPET